jgi:hypothetical protein
MKGNRDIKKSRVQSHRVSIEKHGQKQPALINEKMEIIDGQTRYSLAKLLRKPFKYTVQQGLKIDDVTEINNNSNKWSAQDFATSYANRGNEDYKLYLEFKEKYSRFSHSTILTLLTNSLDRNSKTEDDFRAGTFRIKNWMKATKMADYLLAISEYYAGYNRRSFILAILKVMQTENFCEKRLLRKLNVKSNLVRDFSKTEDYVKALEEVYNWKETNRVRFY